MQLTFFNLSCLMKSLESHVLIKLFATIQKDLSAIYLRCGLKNLGTVFLLTDALIPDEKFLVLINDLLASGEIPDLFHEDEIENIVGSVRNEASLSLWLCFAI